MNALTLTGIIDHGALIAIARLIRNLTIVGSPCPIVGRISDWCNATPQPGDLVIETSSHRMDADRVGLFERFEERVVCHHELKDVEHPGCLEPGCAEWRSECPRPERFVWILVQRNPERRCRWHNARFMRLPKNEAQWREARGGCVPSSFDRSTLVDLLTDYGHVLADSAPAGEAK